jgi:hypothetical protein
VADEHAAERFLSLLGSVLSQKQAYLTSPQGGQPDAAGRWGWETMPMFEGQYHPPSGKPMIGWVQGQDLYLDPEAAYAAVQDLAHEQGGSLGVGAKTVWKRLKEKDLLESADEGRNLLQRPRALPPGKRVLAATSKTATTSRDAGARRMGHLLSYVGTGQCRHIHLLTPSNPVCGAYLWCDRRE